MKREQIEKAANIEMLSHYADEEYPWGIKDIQSDFIEAFSKGAQWRINSVWHVTFEMPERGRDFLYESARGWFGINNTAKMAREVHPENWDRFVEGFDVIRWVYIDDLLSEIKE